MKPDHMPPSAPTPAVPAGEPRPRERGQAMVEFAAVLLPVLLIVVGIIQFGLLFGANVTLTNAVRESARAATIQTYDINETRSANDLARCTRGHRRRSPVIRHHERRQRRTSSPARHVRPDRAST